MPRRGIGVEGVASEIGILGGLSLQVNRQELIDGLCRRFGATTGEAEAALRRAKEVGAVVEENGIIRLV